MKGKKGGFLGCFFPDEVNGGGRMLRKIARPQCGCADVRSVFEIMKKQPQVP
jgi:hypothetical protein